MGSRQAGILVREVLDLKRTQNAEDWPCIIAGGSNFDLSEFSPAKQTISYRLQLLATRCNLCPINRTDIKYRT